MWRTSARISLVRSPKWRYSAWREAPARCVTSPSLIPEPRSPISSRVARRIRSREQGVVTWGSRDDGGVPRSPGADARTVRGRSGIPVRRRPRGRRACARPGHRRGPGGRPGQRDRHRSRHVGAVDGGAPGIRAPWGRPPGIRADRHLAGPHRRLSRGRGSLPRTSARPSGAGPTLVRGQLAGIAVVHLARAGPTRPGSAAGARRVPGGDPRHLGATAHADALRPAARAPADRAATPFAETGRTTPWVPPRSGSARPRSSPTRSSTSWRAATARGSRS